MVSCSEAASLIVVRGVVLQRLKTVFVGFRSVQVSGQCFVISMAITHENTEGPESLGLWSAFSVLSSGHQHGYLTREKTEEPERPGFRSVFSVLSSGHQHGYNS